MEFYELREGGRKFQPGNAWKAEVKWLKELECNWNVGE
jgi:hypothetical protein